MKHHLDSLATLGTIFVVLTQLPILVASPNVHLLYVCDCATVIITACNVDHKYFTNKLNNKFLPKLVDFSRFSLKRYGDR